jgi:tetratricopeptide (TPR) repeat protein
MAPRLYIDVIRIYRQAGFRDRLMETHAAFVEHFAPGNDFWRHHAPADFPDVVRQAETSLIELAQFHHARYLQEETADDFREALHRYRTCLQTFPDSSRGAEIRLQLAELLYARGDDAQAVPEYEQVAYGYGEHPRAADSALNAVLACERRLMQAGATGDGEWQSRCDALAIRFVGHFPQHPDAAVVLSRTGAGLIERQQAEEAVQVCRDILDRGESVSPELRQAAWILLAQSQFSLQGYYAAEQAYREALAAGGLDTTRRAAVSQAMATAIYRQAEQQQAQGDRAGASRGFLRAAEAAPGSPVQPLARYDAAASLLEQQQWDEAARVLVQFRKEHPAHELQDEVTRKLAYAYAQAGRELDAAGEYVTLADVHEDEAIRREALLQAADLYRQAGRRDDAVAVLERYLARYPQPAGEAVQAMQRLAQIEADRGDAKRHQYWLQALIRSDAAMAGDERARELAARARLALADYRIAEFERLGLGEPLQQSLESKLQAMEQAIAELEAAADYGIGGVTTAATCRTGELYHELGRALLESPRPQGLHDEELARYNLLLEEEAAPFEERAIGFHEVNVRRIRAGQYDRWIRQSLAQLGELWPARYARAEQAGALAGDAPGTPVADPDYRQAMTALQAGQYAAAARLLAALDGPAGESHAAQLGLAIAHVQLGNNADAEQAVQRVLAETPDDPVAHNLQGILHRRAGRFRQARDAYEQALRLRPGYSMAHINLGILCDIYLQDTGCAMRHYRDYLRMAAGDDRQVALWLADLERRQDDR